MKFSATLAWAMLMAAMVALATAHRGMSQEDPQADFEDSAEVAEQRRRLAQAAEGGAVVIHDAVSVFGTSHEAVACMAQFSQAIKESAELGASVGSVILG